MRAGHERATHEIRARYDIEMVTTRPGIVCGREGLKIGVDKSYQQLRGKIDTLITNILAEAGVLDGRRATTHWSACEDFARRYPRVNLEADPTYIKDGNVYTSAGASSGVPAGNMEC
jgi:hypothetical protein